MPELNLDKILASLDLRISEVTLPDEYDQISKDYLGKDSLLAEERKKLPTLSNEDKKTYGKKLTELSKKIESKIASSKKQFILDTFQKKEKDEFTEYEIAQLIAYTLQLTDRFCDSNIEIHISKDTKKDNLVYLVYLDKGIILCYYNEAITVDELPKHIVSQKIYRLPPLH